ncbi:MAG: hypothetical protein RLZZ09_3673 [Pseudomonadota bacterium]|jgi:hypothetical protein
MTHPITIIDRDGRYREVRYLSAAEKQLAIDPWALIIGELAAPGPTRLPGHQEHHLALGPEVRT